MENFPSKSSLYYAIPSMTSSSSILIPEQNMLFVHYNDFNNLQNENKELKNKIIELQKDKNFLRTLIFKKNKQNKQNKQNK
jgi:hypothetical protein